MIPPQKTSMSTASIYQSIIDKVSQIHYPRAGHVFSYGSAGIGLGQTYFLDSYNFFVNKTFPFELTKREEIKSGTYIEYLEYEMFERRFDAEECILQKKIKHFKRKVKEPTKISSNFHKRKSITAGFNGDNQLMKHYRAILEKTKKQLASLEDEHPEWSI